MSDITLTIPATQAMQVQASIEERLTRLHSAAASGRLDPFGTAVNAMARMELEAAHAALTGAIYPNQSDLVSDDQFVYPEQQDGLTAAKAMDWASDTLPETCVAAGHIPGCPGRAGGDHEAVSA